ncbi:MAG: helix-turn-helix domain-containing protein [Gammaproteobacteria bacterium]
MKPRNGVCPFVFDWQRAILSPKGPEHSTTRLVLMALSIHMRPDGSKCFPSVRTIALETGLSERSVCTHLQRAEQQGWIRKRKRGTGRGWARHEYVPLFPRGREYSVLNGSEVLNSLPRGTADCSAKALNVVQSNNSVNISKNKRLEKILHSPHPPPNHIIDGIGRLLGCQAQPGEEYLGYWARLRAKARRGN